ncbi:hypothetical protein ZIOFF_058839 [Zingiber officinale]|uniref:Uncharacterized protein n=1 Tax=Zingiber officinale TaxID=94328 RepID=A0A8J5KM88_ZINOF|nr:hypothetical protein ZIOFF_058839 [Zingiber officinale]
MTSGLSVGTIMGWILAVKAIKNHQIIYICPYKFPQFLTIICLLSIYSSLPLPIIHKAPL